MKLRPSSSVTPLRLTATDRVTSCARAPVAASSTDRDADPEDPHEPHQLASSICHRHVDQFPMIPLATMHREAPWVAIFKRSRAARLTDTWKPFGVSSVTRTPPWTELPATSQCPSGRRDATTRR